MMQNSDEVNAGMRRLLEAFFNSRNIKLTADGLLMWIDALCDLPVESIQMAIRRFNREGTEFPTPAAIRKFAGLTAITDDERSDKAWTMVRKTVRLYGYCYDVDFSDPIVNAAIHDMGGWLDLTNTDELKWREKEFKKAYVFRARSGTGNGSHLTGQYPGQQRTVLIDCELPSHPSAKGMERQSLPSMSPEGEKLINKLNITRPENQQVDRA